jgi:pimeloyl-ACP methyl ester carboxylesterase
MPILSIGSLKIDYTDDGQGQSVILIHSSVSANRQWRTLTEALKDRYRVLAINLFGYGETTRWPGQRRRPWASGWRLLRGRC